MNVNLNAGGRKELNPPIIFTKQEHKVLGYSRQLMTNQEIADKLGVCELTVKSHRKNIMKKAGIKGKTAMTRFVMTFKME
ncbi:MAG: helix-turn-helix transcriptional regulator [Arcicella sp.]|nr:helix-turn-helix transcriptional regulator [Arcicella sp.]